MKDGKYILKGKTEVLYNYTQKMWDYVNTLNITDIIKSTRTPYVMHRKMVILSA